MKIKYKIFGVIMGFSVFGAHGTVDESQIVTFSAGSPAKASELNQTIAELVRAIDSNSSAIAEIQDSTAQVTNSVAGRCYNYQSATKKLRSFEDSSGFTPTAYVEILDSDATMAFDINNPTAQLTGETHQSVLIIKGQDKGKFKEFPDFKSYEEPAHLKEENTEFQWTQDGSTVTVSLVLPNRTENFDLFASEDGRLLTGINRQNRTDTADANNKEYQYNIESITLHEIDCSNQ